MFLIISDFQVKIARIAQFDIHLLNSLHFNERIMQAEYIPECNFLVIVTKNSKSSD